MRKTLLCILALTAVLAVGFVMPAFAEGNSSTENNPSPSVSASTDVILTIYPAQSTDAPTDSPNQEASNTPVIRKFQSMLATGDPPTVAILVLLGIASACLAGAFWCGRRNPADEDESKTIENDTDSTTS